MKPKTGRCAILFPHGVLLPLAIGEAKQPAFEACSYTGAEFGDVMVPKSVPEGSLPHATPVHCWQDGDFGQSFGGRRNQRPVRKKDASSQRLSTIGVLGQKAGDEIRTHEIHVGKTLLGLSIASSDKRLRQLPFSQCRNR